MVKSDRPGLRRLERFSHVARCEFPPKGEMFHVVGYAIDDIDYREKTVKSQTGLRSIVSGEGGRVFPPAVPEEGQLVSCHRGRFRDGYVSRDNEGLQRRR